MTYSTMMVQLQLGSPQAGLLRIAGELAERFDAGVIGVVACRQINVSYGDGYTSGGVIEIDYKEIDKEIAEVPLDFFDRTRVLSISDLAMQAGGPVLIVSEKMASLKLDRVLVAWKDTREARRAINDALPMLKKAAEVKVVELASANDLVAARVSVDEVVAWLDRHGVKALAAVAPSNGDDADGLARYAQAYRANVIVAGAYGHSRLREWALGGVTRDLLLSAEHCSLVSH